MVYVNEMTFCFHYLILAVHGFEVERERRGGA
jgi:hypothetical protein